MRISKYYDKLFEKVMLLCDYGKKRTFYLNIDELEYDNDFRIVAAIALNISTQLEQSGFVNQYHICYNERKILYIMGNVKMKAYFTIEIPYRNRSDYFSAISEINNLIDANGTSLLAVNNNPYNLEACLVVETNTGTKQIQDIIEKNHMRIINNKGLDELLMDLPIRKWNMFTLPSNNPLIFKEIYHTAFLFAEESELEKKGFKHKPNIERKKIFISYSHRDKALVNQAVDAMELYGLNVWIDKKEIDIGDDIIERVHSGIEECDLAVLFVSNSTLISNFAKHELRVFEGSIINKEKNWFIIKIDDINMNDVIYGLSNFLYYDFNQNPNLEDLVKNIKKKLEKIK